MQTDLAITQSELANIYNIWELETVFEVKLDIIVEQRDV